MALHSRILHNGESGPPTLRSYSPVKSGCCPAGGFSARCGWPAVAVRLGAPLGPHVAGCALLNVTLPDPADVEGDLRRLIEANGRPDCTLRLAIVRNGGGIWEARPADPARAM